MSHILSVTYAECHIQAHCAECHYAECHIQDHCAECHNTEFLYAECHMLNVIMLSFFILGVVALFMLSVMRAVQ
jgi:hypothetical protein